MKTGKFIAAVLIVCIVSLLAGAVYAEPVKVGHLGKLNMTSEEFAQASDALRAGGKERIFLSEAPADSKMLHVFYDSLTAMVMALNSGEVDWIALPENVAEYVMNVNGGYAIASIVRTPASYLSFGFRKDDDPAMRNKFNETLLAMKADGTLAILRAKYIDEAGLDEPEPVKFEVYDNVDTKIKVAVTGDIPPIDFVAADGTPAGFNTAVIAEIGKRLHINIELVNIDSGARAASLASKRVDAVFWVQFQKGAEKQMDVPEGIALSEAYYSWNEILNLKKK